jgi:hypothetical protein
VKQFLVEVFMPRAVAGDLSAAELRIREAVRQSSVRFVRSTYVPEDETCFYFFEAPSKDLVAKASVVARLAGIRIVEARTTEAGPL